MAIRTGPRGTSPIPVPVILIGILWVVLLTAGGASRADVLGQVLVRVVAWGLVAFTILTCPAGRLRVIDPPLLILGAAIALVAVQLIPLPPALWRAAPGHALFAQAAMITGEAQPWRPLAISPGATVNALGSLVVPAVVLFIMRTMPQGQDRRIVALILAVVVIQAVLGLLQFSGARFDDPLVNTPAGDVAGTFANRNHFALFMAIGCVLAPIWGLRPGAPRIAGALAAGLVLLFDLMILASGSRTGVVVGVLGTIVGLLIVRREAARSLGSLPRRARLTVVGAAVTGGGVIVALSIFLNRAVSFDRIVSIDAADDLRRRALPTVLAMARHYFPWGIGYGGFDPAYRIPEPMALLSPNYFNEAHNDLLSMVLEGGLLGGIILIAAVIWWLARSVGAWRRNDAGIARTLARAGSAIIALVLVASATDYPARTPLIMAMIMTAALWLVPRPRRVGVMTDNHDPAPGAVR